ncbi:glycosyl transferase, group 2 family protein [Altererythrobacter epoxidivorans]|uniref:Glycosyl transferase, group 2 family protein n=1 Tax=Altererythrobacter epoxidivorans TaxID=361183 RepID=A0A0M4MX10_9SPHN|nr:glycosyltransferase family 2 protein [Altererythrobacter epoxidivorans]ALE17388.1 glycosyl transferase, group 2 family protein [Altererythrobacter epoxidivorans]
MNGISIYDPSAWMVASAEAIAAVVIVTGILQTAFNFVLLLYAAAALGSRPPVPRSATLWRRYSEQAPAISVLAPAFNEELTIVESTRSLLALQYPDFEVIVINDGSNDGTLARLIAEFNLEQVDRYVDRSVDHAEIRGFYASPRLPRLLVVDKINGGKADALNAGINCSRTELFCAIDADSLLEPDALLRVVRPFVDNPHLTIAAGGTIRIANGCKVDSGRITDIKLPRNFLALVQIVEYLRAFLMARVGLGKMQALTVISGAFGLFRRRHVVAVGGYSHGTVGEDMELVLKLHRLMREQKRDYRIEFIAEPVCWTECPDSLSVLGRQRARWQRGALECFVKHKDMLFNPRYGRIGMIGFGQILLVDVLGPLLEVMGYVLVPLLWALGLLAFPWLLAFLAVTFTLGIFLSMATLVLEELQLRRFPKARELAVLAGIAVVENFGYRQISNLWRMQGWWQFIRRQQGWGTMTRKGFSAS